jgi:oligosaccharide:H+ symporter
MKRIEINKTGLKLLMINAFIYITFSLYTPYLTSYYSKAGLNALEIGVLIAIGPVVAILIQPLWAILSDRTGRKKDVLSLVVLGSAVTMLSFYIGKSFGTFFIASFLLALFGTSIVPLADAIVLRSAHKNRFDFSKIRMGGTLGFAIVVLLSGEIVKMNPALQFVMGFAGYMILLLFIRRLPKEEADGTEQRKKSPVPKRSLKERLNILAIFESKQIFFILAFAFINQVGLSFTYTFLGVYMVRLGFGEGTIGFINSVSAFSELPVLLLINRFLRKNSSMKLIIAGCFLLGLRILTVTGESLLFFSLSQVLHGLSFMTVYYSCAVFISRDVKPENQSQGQSILAIVQAGIGSIVGNIAGGLLVDSFGLKTAYLTISVAVVSVTALITVALAVFSKVSEHKSLSV